MLIMGRLKRHSRLRQPDLKYPLPPLPSMLGMCNLSGVADLEGGEAIGGDKAANGVGEAAVRNAQSWYPIVEAGLPHLTFL
jgi:hypothetical protein